MTLNGFLLKKKKKDDVRDKSGLVTALKCLVGKYDSEYIKFRLYNGGQRCCLVDSRSVNGRLS